MDVGLLRDRRPFEHRVGLTPGGVKALTDRGHRVYVESNAGLGAGFTDEEYRKVGATIVFSDEEVLLRSQMGLRISPPLPAEYARFQPGQVVLSSWRNRQRTIKSLTLIINLVKINPRLFWRLQKQGKSSCPVFNQPGDRSKIGKRVKAMQA